MLSGFALNVPACAIWPGITWSIMAALPPTAARGNPPPIALPRRSEADSPWQPSDRKSTRLNSSHLVISYAVFCLKKKIVSAVRRYLSRAGARPARDGLGARQSARSRRRSVAVVRRLWSVPRALVLDRDLCLGLRIDTLAGRRPQRPSRDPRDDRSVLLRRAHPGRRGRRADRRGS